MGLLKYLHRKKKAEATRKHVNPFADDSREGSASRSQDHSSGRSGSYSSSVEASSRGGSGARPSVDEMIEKEHERLVEAFRIIDKDGDGKISRQELSMMWENLGEKISVQELRYMIEEADADGDGLIDFDEFVALERIMGVEDHEEHSRAIRLAFNVADIDKSGSISAVELGKVLKELGKQKVTLDECIAMCKVVDADGDGLISFEEFERLMTSSAFRT